MAIILFDWLHILKSCKFLPNMSFHSLGCTFYIWLITRMFDMFSIWNSVALELLPVLCLVMDVFSLLQKKKYSIVGSKTSWSLCFMLYVLPTKTKSCLVLSCSLLLSLHSHWIYWQADRQILYFSLWSDNWHRAKFANTITNWDMAYYRQIWRVCTVVRASVGSGREKRRGIVQIEGRH